MEGTFFISVAEKWLKNIEPTVSKNTYAIYIGYVKNYIIIIDKENTKWKTKKIQQ